MAQSSRVDCGRVRGRRGHLKLMTEMPFDILHEILGQLDPIDLLHLSWSTKTLRDILMTRSGRFLWTNAFARLYESDNPPPGCPPDLNLAQYTLFLFGKRCMECGVRLGNHRSWSMRLRICRPCLHTEKFIRVSRLEGPTEYPWWGLARISTPHGVFFFKTEYDKIRPKVNMMDREVLARQQEEWKQTFDSAREAESAYETWLHNKRQERKEELCLLRAQRREAILQKLNSLGCNDPEIRLYVLTSFSLECSKPKPLTQKEWTTLEPALVERLEGANAIFQQSRHRNKILFRLEILQQRIDYTCRVTEIDEDERPFSEDIAILEPFKSTIFQDTDEPECLFMDDSEFAQVIIGWHLKRKGYILSLLPQELVEDIHGNLVDDPLSLEVAYFCGGGDTTIQYYYQAICRVRQSFGALPADAPKEIQLLGATEFRRPWYWDQDRWTFDIDRYVVATTMMTYLGLDPRSTRPGDFLVHCDRIQLQCLQCKAGEERCLCNCWSAIQHELSYHKDNAIWPGELKWRIDSL